MEASRKAEEEGEQIDLILAKRDDMPRLLAFAGHIVPQGKVCDLHGLSISLAS
jgi:hypothetical protein